MLDEVLRYLHNWFCDMKDIHIGEYVIEEGQIELSFLQENQYFRICGSVFNDGVYQYPVDTLADEEFRGTIWALKIPADFIALVEEIEAWQEEYGSTAAGPYQSESFGGYSYTRASGASDSDSSSITWMDAFATRLAGWRKM